MVTEEEGGAARVVGQAEAFFSGFFSRGVSPCWICWAQSPPNDKRHRTCTVQKWIRESSSLPPTHPVARMRYGQIQRGDFSTPNRATRRSAEPSRPGRGLHVQCDCSVALGLKIKPATPSTVPKRGIAGFRELGMRHQTLQRHACKRLDWGIWEEKVG